MNNNLGDKIQVDLQKSHDSKTPPPVPVFGSNLTVGSVASKPIGQGMQRAGKHGKSHHQYLKVMGSHQPQKLRQITPDQLAGHKSPESAWLSLYGVVYDVTVYLQYHPGGDVLLQGCGKQCQVQFNQNHPWVNGKYLLQKYKIGILK